MADGAPRGEDRSLLSREAVRRLFRRFGLEQEGELGEHYWEETPRIEWDTYAFD